MSSIRIANSEDAKAVLSIYSPFILQTGVTQETEVPAEDAFQQRIINTLKERPWLVCEIENEIAGFAYAGKHRERKGYQWCIEPSVYIDEKYYRYGIAKALYTALFEILKIQGFVNAYAVITLPNEKSVSFHKNFGFKHLTTYTRIGYKLGKWHDVDWWELQINAHQKFPESPLMFSDLDKGILDQILNKAGSLLKK